MKCIAFLCFICALVAYFVFQDIYAAVLFALLSIADGASQTSIFRIERVPQEDYVPEECDKCPFRNDE